MIDPRPAAQDVAKQIAAYYAKPGNGAGGHCHIVLDDENIRDDHVQWCLERCEQEADPDGASIMRIFLGMKRTARLKAIRLAWEMTR